MTDNPFAPPEAVVQDPIAPTGSIDVGRCFSEGWARTWAHFPLWLGVMLVWFVAVIGSVITCVGILLLLPILYWGWIRFTLNMHDGEPKMDDLWEGFQRYGAVLGAMIVLYLIMTLLGIPGQIVQFIGQASESIELILVGMVVNLLWMAFVSLRLYLAPMLVVDQGMEPVEAVKRSWDLTRGNQLSLILLMLLAVVIITVGVLLLVIGVFPAMMLTTMMWISAYRQLVGAPLARTADERLAAEWGEPA